MATVNRRKKLPVPSIFDAIIDSGYVSITLLGQSRGVVEDKKSSAVHIYQLNMAAQEMADLNTMVKLAKCNPKDDLQDLLADASFPPEDVALKLSVIGGPVIPRAEESPERKIAQDQFIWSNLCNLDYIAPNTCNRHRWVNTTEGVIIEFFVDFVPWKARNTPVEES